MVSCPTEFYLPYSCVLSDAHSVGGTHRGIFEWMLPSACSISPDTTNSLCQGAKCGFGNW
jgi:hypothetical protein